MKLNTIVASALVGAVFALQAWTLKEVVNLKVTVAELSVRVSAITTPTKTVATK